ncbi:MAG TPA: PTS sugar transporter subunit IIA [Pirellulales bacterium]|jgi:PTS system nitrogen regulatory IIA component|nr:PTS sugar transporter subunit IIA [Pirellulales bacterium]
MPAGFFTFLPARLPYLIKLRTLHFALHSATCIPLSSPPHSPFRIPHFAVTLSRMAEEDFDLQRLAVYLHLTPAQVSRLAERGKIPGRKVQEQWRFSQADVHHWLESRIGLSDQEELQQMEAIVRPAAGHLLAPVGISQLLPLAAIEVPLLAKTRNSVITAMAEVAARTGLLWDPQKMAEAVRAREDMHPTALEIGVALMHPRRPTTSILGEAFLAFGRTENSIPFGGRSGLMTDLFFLICSTDDRGHLQTLARLSRIIAEPELLAALRAAPDAEAVRQAIQTAEAKLNA